MIESTDNISFHQRLRLERFKRGWSQARLAEEVGVDWRTVRRWEKGDSNPQPQPRQQLCTVLGMTAEELGLELRFAQVGLSEDHLPLEQVIDELSQQEGQEQEGQRKVQEQNVPPLWHEIPSVLSFAGRDKELVELRNWIVVERCKVVAVLGMGGIGKTSLTVTLVEKTRAHFSSVFWCTLQNAPHLEQILPQCIQEISGWVYTQIPQVIEEQISLLIHLLDQKRCLLVLDNLESIVQSRQSTSIFLPGYEPYGTLIQRIGESKHQSCLVVTSREKPDEVSLLEGPHAAVRSWNLLGVGVETGRALLHEKGLIGGEQEWRRLVERYSGNPLALKLAAGPIRELFDSNIRRFLNEGGMLFSSMNALLEQQLERLSPQEYDLLRWLAIEREPVSAERLRENLVLSISKDAVLSSLKSLRRRSMIEKYGTSAFTLQPVIMEYITADLIERFVTAFASGLIAPWPDYALMKAQAPEYVRESQERLLLAPVAQRLLERQNKAHLLQLFQQALEMERQLRSQQSNYLAANILHILIAIGVDLRGLDCSNLVIWQAHLQKALLPSTNFARATFIGSTFVNMAGNALAVAFSSTGRLLAIGTASNEIWLYESKSGTALFTCRGHTDGVWSVAFSADEKWLVSSSDDGSIRLWETRTGVCTGILEGHRGRVKAVAFSPDGKIIASGSDDRTVRIWSAKSGKCLQVFEGHTDRIWSVSFSPDGRTLATGSTDQSIRLWELATGSCLLELHGHEGWVLAVSFSPDGAWLASGGDDCTIRLWNLTAPEEVKILEGHDGRVRSLSFHRDGVRLASGSEDRTVRLWNMRTGEALGVLKGHAHGVRAVAFDPRAHSTLLASGGDDQATRIWDVENARCLKTLQGYTSRVWIVAFSPDGQTLVSGSEDQKVRVWRINGEEQPREMSKRGHALLSLALSADGQSVATGGEDRTIRLWDVASGICVKTLSGQNSWIRSVALSPDGQTLASGSESHAIFLWRMGNGAYYKQLRGHESWIRTLAFSPDGRTLVSGSDDTTVRIWSLPAGNEVRIFDKHTHPVRTVAYSPDGALVASAGEDSVIYLWNPLDEGVRELVGHEGWIRSVAFSPDGKILVSGSEDRTVRVWDVESGACLYILRGHSERVRSVACSPLGKICASSSDDGTIRLWDIQSGEFLKMLRSERPYEGMVISGVEGLTDAQRLNLKALGAVE